MMGIRPIKSVDRTILTAYLRDQHVSTGLILEADPVRYNNLISSKLKDTSCLYCKWYVQNHIQPVQTIIYDKAKKISLASYFNCNAEQRHVTNLTWNKNHELEFFPALTYTDSIWNDSFITAAEILDAVNLVGEGSFKHKNNDKKYLVLIFYSIFTKKQSNNIIRETRYHLDQCLKDSFQLLYINMDNYMFSQSK